MSPVVQRCRNNHVPINAGLPQTRVNDTAEFVRQHRRAPDPVARAEARRLDERRVVVVARVGAERRRVRERVVDDAGKGRALEKRAAAARDCDGHL